MWRNIWILYKREFASYFHIPAVTVGLILFLVLSGVANFYFGNFFTRGQADLLSFFSFHPWLYMLFIPALTMRTWSEERKTGSIELLFTLPITVMEIVLAKFFAAWSFVAVALSLTFPLWITINYLGDPDNATIAACYFSSILMAGGFVAIGVCISAYTKHQMMALSASTSVYLGLNIIGIPTVMESLPHWIPTSIIQSFSNISFITNFDAVNGGLLKVSSLLYFTTLMLFFIIVNKFIIESKRLVE